MKLLVSVRSAEEALTAVAGGADLIDVKEPLRGSLGRADDAIIQAVIDQVGDCHPVSAALGELKDIDATANFSLPLDYLKFGLSGCRGVPWQNRAQSLRESSSTLVVPTAYADHHRAESPLVEDVLNFAISEHWPVLLIDTYLKDGTNLFEWMTEKELATIIDKSSAHRIKIALAGALRIDHIPTLRRLRPEWVAIRGAACRDGTRNKQIELAIVRSFKEVLDG